MQTANLGGLLDGLEKGGDMVGEKFVGGKRGAEVGECHMREFCRGRWWKAVEGKCICGVLECGGAGGTRVFFLLGA